jgi:hypothetical protein
MSYQSKYLKYKIKYIALRNTLNNSQLGGVHIKAIDKLRELVTSKKLNETPLTINDIDFSLLTQLFLKLIKTNYSGFLPIDSIDDYIGKLNIKDNDLYNLGFRYDKEPTGNTSVNIIKPVYLYETKELKTSINYNPTNNTITFNSSPEISLQLPNPNQDVFVNLKTIVAKIKENKGTRDDQQISGFKDPDSYIYTRLTPLQVEANLLKCFGNNEGRNNIHYYPSYNLLIILIEDDGLCKYRMYYVKKEQNNYQIFPHSYLNPILNDEYSVPVKKLFTSITSKLKEIIPSINYVTSPDRFFHIHVTPVNGEKRVLLTLHVLYELENKYPEKAIFNYNGNIIDRVSSLSTISSSKRIEYRKQHSFYMLYNLESNEHYIYNLLELATNENYFPKSESLGIKETIFGETIADINYIGDSYNVIITKTGRVCEYMCDDLKTD